jgi:hypothetical protein
MNIDWNSLSEIVTGISAIVVAITAVCGLQTWKKQIKGETEYDLARRMLISVYEVREAISEFRNPWQSGVETEHAKKQKSLEGDYINEAQTQEALYWDRRSLIIACHTRCAERDPQH